MWTHLKKVSMFFSKIPWGFFEFENFALCCELGGAQRWGELNIHYWHNDSSRPLFVLKERQVKLRQESIVHCKSSQTGLSGVIFTKVENKAGKAKRSNTKGDTPKKANESLKFTANQTETLQACLEAQKIGPITVPLLGFLGVKVFSKRFCNEKFHHKKSIKRAIKNCSRVIGKMRTKNAYFSRKKFKQSASHLNLSVS